jgi:ABC-type amino acid transport substrate-binding protein
MPKFRKLFRDFGGIVVVVCLLLLVTLLPPDTSLHEVQKNKTLRVCTPSVYPPLVTGNPEQPGIDVEILQALTKKMGVKLMLNPNDAMGRDFNPRNWAINRGKCEVIAGGVINSKLTRSFLDTGPSYASSGWAIISPSPLGEIKNQKIGVLSLISGMDRIGLASYLRSREISVQIFRNSDDLISAINRQEIPAGVTEVMLAGFLAKQNNWIAELLPNEINQIDLVFGLWKGDLTLKREIRAAFNELENQGVIAEILARYGVDKFHKQNLAKF